MITIPYKTKQLLILVAKLFVVGGAFYFIYNELAHNDKLEWTLFIEKFNKNKSVLGILFILFLSVLNRYLEILKWKNLVSYVQHISVFEASQQVLGALTVALFTPNGIGEYAGKALYYKKSDTKKILFLNLICNGIQMIITVLFGAIGFVVINNHFGILSTNKLLILILMLLVIISFLFFAKNINIKGYSIAILLFKLHQIPSDIHFKNFTLGLLRYLVFSHQYFFLFKAFDVDLPYFLLMATITTVYFLASSLPTFQFLDFAVKGSVAVYFFGLLGVNEWIVIFISTLMWLLNVVLPVVIGSYFVLNFKTE
jgi:hypothetical protein